MIRWDELVLYGDEPNRDQILNLQQLHYRLNVIRSFYKHPMIITSGFRSWARHQDIYERLNSQRVILGKPKLMAPPSSQHLFGSAADIDDPRQELQRWVLENLEIVENLGLYFESFEATPHWVHCQLFPPKSGKRFFDP